MIWWATGVECIAALARREREGTVTSEMVGEATVRLERLLAAWEEIQPTDAFRRTAMRMLRMHALRAADAFQLAAARVASEERPDTLPFVTLDDRLALAAQREGFGVIRPAT